MNRISAARLRATRVGATLGLLASAMFLTGNLFSSGSQYWREHTYALSDISIETYGSGALTLVDSAGPTLLLVFSPRCAVCQTIAPSWMVFAEKVRHVNGRVIAVSFSDEEAQAVSGFLTTNQLDADLGVVDRRTFRAVSGVEIVPTAMVLDPDGLVRFMKQGGGISEVLQAELVPLLARTK